MTQKVLGPGGSRRRKTRLLVLTALFATFFAALFVTASSGTLSGGSTFESGDGDLAANTSTPPAAHDWNAPVEAISCGTTIPGGGANCGLDLVKNQADNALGQGAKEDDPAPTVVNGSIPPSKDDLSRFYVNKEKAGGNEYLYLAWERSNLLGSAHMDFEFNQDSTLSANGVTPVRTAGDLLIDFDFGGSGVPVLQKHTWITTGSTSSCEASNSLPCWDKGVNLGAFAESAVNSAPVVDTNNPSAPRTLDGNTKNGINSTFGEAGINLTGSGILPANSCKHFGAAYLKSRSSGNSFTSELKDFIAPIPVNISNCGEIKVIKTTDPADQDVNFPFTTNMKTIGGSDSSCTGPTITSGAFNLNASAAATKTEDCKDLLPSSGAGANYTVAEGALPSPWAFTSVTCTSKDSTSTIATSGKIATITLAAEDVVTCTYLNNKPKASPGATSAPNLIPNDSVTVTGFDANGSKDGVLTVALWDNSSCSTANSGTKLYEKTFTVTGAGPYVTTNDGTGSSPAGYKISGDKTAVSYYWSVAYAGDTRNNPFSYCASPSDEYVTVTIKGKS